MGEGIWGGGTEVPNNYVVVCVARNHVGRRLFADGNLTVASATLLKVARYSKLFDFVACPSDI